jgi:hypothetical protein
VGTGNAIINSAFDFWQRGSSGNFTGSGYSYVGADRWWVFGYNASSTLSRQTFTPGAAPIAGYESEFFGRFNSTNTSNFFGQRIENVRTYAGETVTLSFWAKSNAAQTLSLLELEQNFGSGGSASTYTNLTLPTLTTSWARYTATVALPSLTGKTIGTASFLQIGFKGAINNAIDLWGVQLESGSSATPFRRNTPNIQGELAACKRYYQRWNEAVALGTAGSTTVIRMMISLDVPPRTINSITLNTMLFNDGTNFTFATGTFTFAMVALSNTMIFNYTHGSSVFTQFRPYYLSNQGGSSSFEINGEL